MDRHEIWRRVEQDWQRANDRRAQGYDAVVHAHVAGRGEPIPVAFATTYRGPDKPWVRLEAQEPHSRGDQSGAIPPTCYWIHVHETALLAIEVSYVRSSERQAVGFSWRVGSPDDEPECEQELAA
jgi:hypothetical protein